ncbi:extracellular solute-binding protein [Thiospirochaeta perfilievii]|uniref:Extracellular solute-binding protein n=1 Tax=Thiospirochaeta perfilievii TaxID=252967 RepID=A0A5C1QCX1_9SPIO|nr:extracellular solute-binding protein [Thiospirochaeta perfilievii]QEN04052.1 extracellular solute-binding protein [Thiospirochaeta perfilievii]
MQIVKKVWALLLISLLGVSSTFSNSQKEAGTENGVKTVSVWTLWTDGTEDVNAVAFRKALESAKTDLPGIVIEHDGTANEAYKTKIKTAIAADEQPDVFFAWGAGFVKPFIDAGKVLPLDEYLADGTSDRIKGGANTNFTFDNKTYGLTFTQWVASLYCNQELFDKYGVKIPETYDELLTAVDVFNQNGIIPITVGEKDLWPGMFWQNAFAIRTAGADASNAALAGRGSFDTPDFVRSAQLLKDLVDRNAFVEGALGIDYNESGALLLEGQAAMYYMGNWFAGDIAGHDSDIINKIVPTRFPTIEGGKGDNTQYLGGSIDGLCVSKTATDLDAATTVAKYLMEQVSRNLAEAGEGIPTWKTDDVVTTKENPVVKQVKELITNSTGYVLAWDTFLEGADADDHKNYVAELFGDTISAEDFAKKMQEINK